MSSLPTVPNLNIEPRQKTDGNFMCYVITVASDDYIIHDRSGDFYGPDPDGNPVYEPYYTYGPCTEINENYDWDENPRFEAVRCCEIEQNT